MLRAVAQSCEQSLFDFSRKGFESGLVSFESSRVVNATSCRFSRKGFESSRIKNATSRRGAGFLAFFFP